MKNTESNRNILKSCISVLTVILISTLNTGAGYIGDLPQLGKFSVNAESNTTLPKPPKEPIMQLAPNKTPPAYSGVIINRGKYSQYLQDLDELIPILESMKQIIETRNADVQMFCAKANTIDLYANNMIARYGNRTERHYESYRQIMQLNKQLKAASDYWRYTNKYNKFVRGSVKDREADKKMMNQKLTTTLKSLKTAIEILKENTSE